MGIKGQVAQLIASKREAVVQAAVAIRQAREEREKVKQEKCVYAAEQVAKRRRFGF